MKFVFLTESEITSGVFVLAKLNFLLNLKMITCLFVVVGAYCCLCWRIHSILTLEVFNQLARMVGALVEVFCSGSFVLLSDL